MERFLVDLRERRADFLSLELLFELSEISFFVEICQYWRRRRVTQRSEFKFSGSTVVRKLGARKVHGKRTVSVVGYKLKIKECFLQKL